MAQALLGGSEDLVSICVTPIIYIVNPVIPMMNLSTNSPELAFG